MNPDDWYDPDEDPDDDSEQYWADNANQAEKDEGYEHGE